MIFEIWYRTHWTRQSAFFIEDKATPGEVRRLARKRRTNEEEEIMLLLRSFEDEEENQNR